MDKEVLKTVNNNLEELKQLVRDRAPELYGIATERVVVEALAMILIPSSFVLLMFCVSVLFRKKADRLSALGKRSAAEPFDIASTATGVASAILALVVSAITAVHLPDIIAPEMEALKRIAELVSGK